MTPLSSRLPDAWRALILGWTIPSIFIGLFSSAFRKGMTLSILVISLTLRCSNCFINIIFILPSLWPENAPISAREAAAAGLQIICRKDSGAMEMSTAAIGINPSVSALIEAIRLAPTTRVIANSAHEPIRALHDPSRYLSPNEEIRLLLDALLKDRLLC